MTEPTERWFPVVGYEGFYEVSDLGRIHSRRRKGAPKIRDGTNQAGTRNAMVKLTEASVLDIRRRHLAGETLAQLAREYEVVISNVWLIVHNVTWRHILLSR